GRENYLTGFFAAKPTYQPRTVSNINCRSWPYPWLRRMSKSRLESARAPISLDAEPSLVNWRLRACRR
ncbi:hypothetical protein IAQ61_009054, partial [Plenodomus lingam]